MDQISTAAAMLHGEVWPNGLGFDTRGADGRVYEVWGIIRGDWAVRRLTADGSAGETYGHGAHVLSALAECVTPCS